MDLKKIHKVKLEQIFKVKELNSRGEDGNKGLIR